MYIKKPIYLIHTFFICAWLHELAVMFDRINEFPQITRSFNAIVNRFDIRYRIISKNMKKF